LSRRLFDAQRIPALHAYVIVIFWLLKRHSKAKRMTPAY